jgi:hypothetical protein
MVEQAPTGAWSTLRNTNWLDERSVKAGREGVANHNRSGTDVRNVARQAILTEIFIRVHSLRFIVDVSCIRVVGRREASQRLVAEI